MKIYFRRAIVNPGIKNSLPDDFIVESVQESGYTVTHSELPGWEVLEEAEFQVEFAKNQERYDAFILEKEARIKAEEEAYQASLQNKEEEK